MPLEFRYFRGPESDISLLPYLRTCSLCGHTGRCFSLDSLISREMTEAQRQGKIGCVDCLKQDRFGFDHDTEVGYITENGLETYAEPSDEPRQVFVVASDGEATPTGMPLIHPPQPHVSDEAVAELRRTPSFSTWQDYSWPVHHNDFMTYVEYRDSPNVIVFECLHRGERVEIDDPD